MKYPIGHQSTVNDCIDCVCVVHSVDHLINIKAGQVGSVFDHMKYHIIQSNPNGNPGLMTFSRNAQEPVMAFDLGICEVGGSIEIMLASCPFGSDLDVANVAATKC
jgi:hypothetical protein